MVIMPLNITTSFCCLVFSAARLHLTGHWLREQSGVPFHMWYRPSGWRADRTRQRTKIMNFTSFYQDSSEPFKMKVPSKLSKKALPFSLFDELLVKQQVTGLDKAIVHITIGTAFFACCSCKCLKVPRREMKCTTLFWHKTCFQLVLT